jgi:Methyltransferase domain
VPEPWRLQLRHGSWFLSLDPPPRRRRRIGRMKPTLRYVDSNLALSQSKMPEAWTAAPGDPSQHRPRRARPQRRPGRAGDRGGPVAHMLGRSRRRVARAGYTGRIGLIQSDAHRLPLRDGVFDAVFMSFVLELIDTPRSPCCWRSAAGSCAPWAPGHRLPPAHPAAPAHDPALPGRPSAPAIAAGLPAPPRPRTAHRRQLAPASTAAAIASRSASHRSRRHAGKPTGRLLSTGSSWKAPFGCDDTHCRQVPGRAWSVDVEPAECEHGRGEGAQAGDDQDRVVAGADSLGDLAVAYRPVEQGRVPSWADP